LSLIQINLILKLLNYNRNHSKRLTIINTKFQQEQIIIIIIIIYYLTQLLKQQSQITIIIIIVSWLKFCINMYLGNVALEAY